MRQGYYASWRKPKASKRRTRSFSKYQKMRKDQIQNTKNLQVKENFTTLEAYAINLATEKGASCWLSALPLKRDNFDLTKSEFRYEISLRYGLVPTEFPSV